MLPVAVANEVRLATAAATATTRTVATAGTATASARALPTTLLLPLLEIGLAAADSQGGQGGDKLIINAGIHRRYQGRPVMLEQLVRSHRHILEIPSHFIHQKNTDVPGQSAKESGPEEGGVGLTCRAKFHHGRQQLTGAAVAEIRHLVNLLRHLDHSELVGDEESLREPLVRLLSWRLSY